MERLNVASNRYNIQIELRVLFCLFIDFRDTIRHAAVNQNRSILLHVPKGPSKRSSSWVRRVRGEVLYNIQVFFENRT